MAKMQKHNNVLSSKLHDTWRELYDQQSHSAQLRKDLDQTTALRQEQSFISVSKSCSHGKNTEIGSTINARSANHL
ncbi:unnamed protein product [Prunus armeniaca]